MKEIKLTQGKCAIVDDEDYEILNAFRWYAWCYAGLWYAKRNFWVNGKCKTVYMHRKILNAQQGIEIDHRNGNGLDNRKENLRLCTHRQNMCNKKQPRKGNKLGIKGVYWNKECKKFRAKIQSNGKTIHLGLFNVLDDADIAYRRAELKYFGEFTRESTRKLYQVA